MSKKLARTSVSMTAVAAFMTLLLVGAAPALAHHRSDHAVGEGNSASPQRPTDDTSTGDTSADDDGATTDTAADEDADTFTENTDTNDGSTPNNVNDDGDNAHPSGNDRSIENGGSGNQGDAQSNPDDTNGPRRSEGAPGADEPNGPGGTDLADQDGNNGCGNDDDFNDDNNGNCGPRDKGGDEENDEENDEETVVIEEPDTEEVPTPGAELLPEIDMKPSTPVDVVLGTRTSKAPGVAQVIAAAAPAVQTAPAAQGATLPFTGISLATFLMVALALLAAGLTSVRLRPATIRK